MEPGYREPGPGLDVSESQIRQILRQKRKARERQACYPCRQRKVKCDRSTPCQRCVDRGHQALCSYQQPSKGRNATPTHSPPSKPLWSKLETIETLVREVKSELSGHRETVNEAGLNDDMDFGEDMAEAPQASTSGIQAGTAHSGEFVHIGGNSVPAMAIALGSGSKEGIIQEVTGKSVLPLFGLDNESATYPFVDLWGLPAAPPVRVAEICKLIPASADCFQLLRQYRDGAHILFPGVVDIEQMEADFTQFLTKRPHQDFLPSDYIDYSSTVEGKSLNWVGLLFASLASGCQSSGLPRKERQLTSQVYGKSLRHIT